MKINEMRLTNFFDFDKRLFLLFADHSKSSENISPAQFVLVCHNQL